ncbi:MAG: AAA family ATPase [Planctomycetota bacterium]
MHDQANDLRELVRQGAAQEPSAPASRPKLLVLTGGKGGVGTTTVAVNLAAELARSGRRTVLVDADPLGGDAATLAGIEERYTLADVLEARRTVSEALQPGPGGLRVLPAAWALGSVSETSAAALQRLIGQLQALAGEADLIVVDAGNGLNRLARQFWRAADLVLAVTTPDPTSVMDTYASIKVLSPDRDSVPIGTLVNRAPSRARAREAHARLSLACRRFLGVEISGVGYVGDDPRVAAAGRARTPLVTTAPRCRSTRQIRRLAKTIIQPTKRTPRTT